MKVTQDLNNVADASADGVRKKIAAALFDGEPRDKFDAAARGSFLDSVVLLMQRHGGQFCKVG